jgi:hypothetical protein
MQPGEGSEGTREGMENKYYNITIKMQYPKYIGLLTASSKRDSLKIMPKLLLSRLLSVQNSTKNIPFDLINHLQTNRY